MTFQNHDTAGEADPAAADRIEEYLLQTYGMRRRPTVAAHILALICDLHEKGEPFPQREAIAKKLRCSIFSVDNALSTYLARGELTGVETDLVEGNIQQRVSVIRRKFYTPSRRLLELAGAMRRRVA